MASNPDYGKVKRTETTTSWEHGKLKLTLTRKSTIGSQGQTTSEDKVTVINRDPVTRNPDGSGFMWTGSLDDFKNLATSIACLETEVLCETGTPVVPLYGAQPRRGE